VPAVKPAKYTPGEMIVLCGVGLASAFLYAGFYFPDPHFMMQQGRRALLLLFALRLGLPCVALFVLGLNHQVKRGRLKTAHVVLLVVALLLGGIVCYPVLALVHARSFKAGLSQYHPYLQLAPHDADLKPGEKGDEMRVFCLGGSTTEFTDSKGKGWPVRLEGELRARLGTEHLRVYNQGRQWYTTLHTLINYQTNLRQHKPDVVIVMHTINDLLHNADFSYFSGGRFRQDYGHFHGPVSRMVRRQGLPAAAVSALGSLWYHEERRVIDEPGFRGERPFAQNLNTLIDLAQADGARVVLMTQPSLYAETASDDVRKALYMLNVEAVGPDAKWSYETARRGFVRYGEIIRQVAQERDVTLIDLEQSIPRTLDFFSDDVHYTDKAFDVIASAVASVLVDSGVVVGVAPLPAEDARE